MKTHEYNGVNGQLGAIGTTRAEVIAFVENLNLPSDGETISGAGAITLSNLMTFLNAESGTYTVTLPDGDLRGKPKEILFIGSASSTAVFNVPGTLWNFTSLRFSGSGRFISLRWTGARWTIAGGDAEPIP